MSTKEILERRDQQAARLAEIDRERYLAIAADGAGTLRWAMASGVTVNSGGIALLASQASATLGDQWAMTLLMLSIVAMILAGWMYSRSAVNEAASIHLSLAERHCEGADFTTDRDDLWSLSIGQDRVAAGSGIFALFTLLTGGLLGIWL